ncbi:hypothetical protein [Clostridium butyricum]|uniref:hypothetical protein n=1 Tax=Clostridium butyricum TaxID=1492 RepID=UPI00374E22AF
MNNSLVFNDCETIDLGNSSKILNSQFNNHYINIKDKVFNNATEIISGAEKIKEIINPEKTYIAKFPLDVIERMNNGQYDLMKSKKGEILSTIIDKTLPKNRNIVHQVRLEEVSTGIQEKLKDLSTNVSNIILQKQLADFSQKLEQINIKLIEVKRGQVLDRIALVKAGKEKLEQAMQLNDNDPNKKQLIINAVSGLNDCRAQLELYIKEILKKDIKIPERKIVLILKALFNSEYYDELKSTYGELQEGMNAYFEATNILAISYQIIDSREAIKEVFNPAKCLIQDCAGKMRSLAGVVLNDKIDDDVWYEDENKLLLEINNYIEFKIPRKKEYISIEFKGKELLEAEIYE